MRRRFSRSGSSFTSAQVVNLVPVGVCVCERERERERETERVCVRENVCVCERECVRDRRERECMCVTEGDLAEPLDGIRLPHAGTPPQGGGWLRQKSGVGCRMWGVECGMWSAECMVYGVGCRVTGVERRL